MDRTRYIVAGNFIDGSGTGARRNMFLAVQGSIITAVGSVGDLPSSDTAVIEDFSHCTILPALVDCSISLSQSSAADPAVRSTAVEAGSAEKTAMLERHVRYCHIHGVLGVAASEDITGMNKLFRDEMGHKGIITIRQAGADFLRIDYSPHIEDLEERGSRLSYEDLCSVLKNRDGKKVVAVANGRRQVAEALAAGCDAIEQGYGMGEDNLRKMAEKKVLWIPSVLRSRNSLDGAAGGGDVCCRFSTRYIAPGKADPGAEAFWKKVLADQLAQLHRARELGVTTAVGTGAGSAGILHGESVVEEIKLFIKAGYSLVESIRCASGNGAAFFGMENLGALAVGRPATFLLSRGTVQQLPRKLAYLEGIYVDGAPSSIYRKNPVRNL